MNLANLNSLTKYPSIETYHPMGDKGRLQPMSSPRFDPGETLYVTEKIDGTNARILLLPDGDYFIGSREHLLYAKGDRLGDPAQGIVAAIRSTAEDLSALGVRGQVVFGEVYGGRITGASKQYTDTQSVGFRVFDVMMWGDGEADLLALAAPAGIAAWRDGGGQRFMHAADLRSFTDASRLVSVPARAELTGRDMPTGLRETADWLEDFRATHAGIDTEKGDAEGVVIRSADRTKIYKLRFEDYRRTLGRR